MSKLTPQQIEVLNSNTLTSITNGFAPKYHSVLDEDFESADWLVKKLETEGLIEDADEWNLYSQNLGRALMAEVPLVFYFEPSNLSESVFAGKINPETGKIVKHSNVFVGLVGGLAGEGEPHYKFGKELLDFAISSIESQNKTGLVITY